MRYQLTNRKNTSRDKVRLIKKLFGRLGGFFTSGGLKFEQMHF